MAKKDKDTGEDGEGKKKKKPIVPILVVVLGLVGAKMFLMKPATKTPEQVAAEKKKAELDVYNACAEANDKPTLTDMVDSKMGETTTTAKGGAQGNGAPATGGGRTLRVQLIAARAEGGAPAEPIVEGMGPILGLDSVTVNLADGNYLRLGLALQLAEGVDATAAKDQGVGDKALDMALTELAKHDIKALLPPAQRQKIKDDLGFETCRAYDGKVLTIYFTEFVMQKAP